MPPDPIDLYTAPGWPGGARARELLRQTGRPVRFRDLEAQPLSWDELKHLAGMAGGVRHLLSTQVPGYRGRGLDQPAVSEIDLLNEMIEDPSLIRQPIVVVDGVVLVGFGGPWPNIVPPVQRR
ncbi:MAG TPA: ArsC/Spx/MgsR family protein [Terriglobales bacterium]|nr:ArsC/Spx/MgsR family protein [Terriglobales bacterium]